MVEKSASRSGVFRYFSRYQRSASVRWVSSATPPVYGRGDWTNVRCEAPPAPARWAAMRVFLALVSTCVLALAAAAPASAVCANEDAIPTVENLDLIREAVVCLHNDA